MAPSVVIDEPIEQKICFRGGVEGVDEPRVSTKVDQREPMGDERAGPGGGQRSAARLPCLDGGLVDPERTCEVLLREVRGLARDLEQRTGDEAARGTVGPGLTRTYCAAMPRLLLIA